MVPTKTQVQAVIDHILFKPTLLASTGRHRFTLRNDTMGDLPIRWEISDAASTNPQQTSPPPSQPQERKTFAAGTFTSPQGEGGRGGEGAALATLPNIEERGNSHAIGFAPPFATLPHDDTIPRALPPSLLVASTSGDCAGRPIATAHDVATADRGPFDIFPAFAVVPANGEVSFEVAFSPATLREAW